MIHGACADHRDTAGTNHVNLKTHVLKSAEATDVHMMILVTCVRGSCQPHACRCGAYLDGHNLSDLDGWIVEVIGESRKGLAQWRDQPS